MVILCKGMEEQISYRQKVLKGAIFTQNKKSQKVEENCDRSPHEGTCKERKRL